MRRRIRGLSRRPKHAIFYMAAAALVLAALFLLTRSPHITLFDGDLVWLVPVGKNGEFQPNAAHTRRLATDGAVFLECKMYAQCQTPGILRAMATTAALDHAAPNSMAVVLGVQDVLQNIDYTNINLGMGDLLHAVAFSKPADDTLETITDHLETSLLAGPTICSEPKYMVSRWLSRSALPSVEAWNCHVSALGGMARILDSASLGDVSSKWFGRLSSLLMRSSSILATEMGQNRVLNMKSPGVADSFCREVSRSYVALAHCAPFCAVQSLHDEVRSLCHAHSFDEHFKRALVTENAVVTLLRPQDPPSVEYEPCALHSLEIDGNHPSEESVTPALRSQLNNTLGPYARFMTERSVRDVRVFGGVYKAFTETEKAISGDDWIWTDDNAKMLELLVLPGVYETVGPIANKVLQFILKMIKSDFMLRRVAGPTTDATMEGFKVDSDKCLTNVRLHNGLMNFNGTPNALDQSYRFHDGRDLDVIKHKAPQVFIKLQSKPSKLLVFNLGESYEQCIFRPVQDMGKIETGYSGTMFHKGVAIATFEYLIVLNSKDTATDHQVVITPAPGGPKYKARVRMTVETIPNDQYNVRLQRLVAYRNGSIEEHKISFIDTGLKVNAFTKTAPQWYAAVMPGNAGFAYSSFRFITNPQHYLKTVYETRTTGFIFFKKVEVASVSTWYECEPGVDCRVAERNLITAGGLYEQMERYIDIMEEVSRGENVGMIDYSISYDIGAELNGLASFYLFATQNSYNTTFHHELNITEIKEAIDHHFHIYWQIFCKKDYDDSIPNLFLRGLSFTAIAVNTMYAATGDKSYLKQLEFAMDIMFSPKAVALENRNRQVGEFLYRCIGDQEWTSVDCQASAHLLFGRLLATFPFGVSGRPSLQLCRIAKAAVMSGSPVFRPFEQEFGPNFTLALSTEATFRWGFQGGLLTRGINAVRVGRERFPNACPYHTWSSPSEQAMWANLEAATNKYSEESTTYHDGGRLKEIRTSRASTETNTESQPWIAMGLHGHLVEKLYRVALHRAYHVGPKLKRVNVSNWY